MPKKTIVDPLAELEKTQDKLRENIEESKQLVEKAQALIQKAKGDGGSEAPKAGGEASPQPPKNG